MILRILPIASILFLSLIASQVSVAVEATLETKKIGGATHWEPEKVVVHQGDELILTAKNDLEGPFDFHGLFIPALKVNGKPFAEKIVLHHPQTFKLKIPNDMKPGNYPISCQFHKTHVGATLVVEPAIIAKKGSAAKSSDKTDDKPAEKE